MNAKLHTQAYKQKEEVNNGEKQGVREWLAAGCEEITAKLRADLLPCLAPLRAFYTGEFKAAIEDPAPADEVAAFFEAVDSDECFDKAEGPQAIILRKALGQKGKWPVTERSSST